MADNNSKSYAKSHSVLRWLILLFTCVMMIGNYYCYDIPAALHAQMDEYMGKPSNFETYFSLLYTVYSVPNIFLPFFGGYFVDRLGVRLCLLVFASFITAGQVIFAFGLSIKSWPVMFLGRVIYGFGGESLGVGNSAILSQWFMGKELAFAFGLNLSVARLGSVINNFVSPALANSAGIQFALWFGAILCGASVFCVVCLSSIDKSMEPGVLHTQLTEADEEVQVNLQDETTSKSSDEEPAAQLKDVFKFSEGFWILVVSCVVVYGCVLPFNNIASALLLERNYFMEPPNQCHLQSGGSCQSDGNQPVGCPTSSYYQPPLPYDVTITINGVATYYAQVTGNDIDCSVSDWSNNCGKVYCDRLKAGEVQAAAVMSIPYAISAGLSPVLGGFVDKFGYRAVIATVAPGVLILVHSLLGYTDVSPVGPLVGQGLAYSGFAAVLWPSVPLVVAPKFIGLGYGVITSIQNGGLAAFPLIVAAIYSDSNSQYIPSAELFFVCLATIGVAVGLYLNFYDFRHGNVFNVPGKPPIHAQDEDLTADLLANDKAVVVSSVEPAHKHHHHHHDERRLSSDAVTPSVMH